jgi:predicted nicotinamide N-methyase
LPTPDKAPDAWRIERHRIGGRELLLARPRDPDRLLDDPAVQQASRATDYMPYWAYLWPGARLLAEYVLAQEVQAPGRVIEIGCGLGLAGLAALAANMDVTFSDYAPAALALAAHNARLNGFDRFTTRLIDWQDPPREPFPLILGADVLYEPRCVTDVLRVLDRMLDESGEAWLSDPHRAVADEFPPLAERESFAVDIVPVQGVFENDRIASGRVFRVRR